MSFLSILFLGSDHSYCFCIVCVLTNVAFSHYASLQPLRYAGCYAFAPAGDGVTVGCHSFLLFTYRGPVTILVIVWVLPTDLVISHGANILPRLMGWWLYINCFVFVGI